MEQAAEVEVDRLVEQVPQHLLEQEPLLGPLLATHRPNTEVVYTVTEHCRQTVIDIVEEEWQGDLHLEKEENLSEAGKSEVGKSEVGESEIGESQLQRGRPSMEATVQRVLENVDALKEHWRLERRKRERKKKIHLVLAITAMVAIALAVVGIRVLLSPLPSMSIKAPKTPTFQWVMDYNIDFPDSLVTERKIPVKWESIYSFDYWLFHRLRKPPPRHS